MPKNITLITPDNEQVYTTIEGNTVSLPWLHPYERMNGRWAILETGYVFDIELVYNQPDWEMRIASCS